MKEIFKKIVVTILTFEAKIVLKRTKPTIIGVTGNVGKTSTKDAIYTALKTSIHTRKNEKSFNSEIGVPLTILGLRNGWNSPWLWLRNVLDGAHVAFFVHDYPKVLVLEMGVDQPGDMKRLGTWVRPDIVVLTRFPEIPVHVEFFKDSESIAAEKMELVHALKPDGVVVYNHDDERIRQALEEVRQRTVSYSRYSKSQYKTSAEEVIYSHGRPTGLKFDLEYGDDVVEVKLNDVLGIPQLYTTAAAAAVAAEFSVPLADVAESLSNTTPTPARMRIISGAEDTTIIDDTYNSSPAAAEHALLTLGTIKTDGRRIAVLGDMLELGQFSTTAHDDVGKLVPENADMLVTVGMRSRNIAKSALANGMSEKFVWQYDDVERAAVELRAKIQPGDVILVKASQSIRAEKVVKQLMKYPEKAPELLVRQDSAWQKR